MSVMAELMATVVVVMLVAEMVVDDRLLHEVLMSRGVAEMGVAGSEVGWRGGQGNGYMATMTAAWMAALRAMVGCKMAASEGGWNPHPPP
jgi:hypothetical protein